MDYKQKYLKYKEKYFSLKQDQIGGTISITKDPKHNTYINFDSDIEFPMLVKDHSFNPITQEYTFNIINPNDKKIVTIIEEQLGKHIKITSQSETDDIITIIGTKESSGYITEHGNYNITSYTIYAPKKTNKLQYKLTLATASE